MNQYIVTDKHPAIKEGCIIKESSIIITEDNESIQVFSIILDGVFIEHVLDVCVVENIENGWIKENL